MNPPDDLLASVDRLTRPAYRLSARPGGRTVISREPVRDLVLVELREPAPGALPEAVLTLGA